VKPNSPRNDEDPVTEQWWRHGATELAQLIRTREVASREVIESHLRRIDEVNPRVNAVVEILAEQSLELARSADDAIVRGDPLGHLHGVPFTVKSNIDLAGTATTEGVKSLQSHIAATDGPTVAKMRRAGAIPMARTNMPDFGLRITSESELFGETHNPWNHSLTAGGSSGGEAAALATGMSPVGLGNDLGGSLRNPAYCCGVASIKPGFGRVPDNNDSAMFPMPLAFQLMVVQGALARSVGDVRLALTTIMGSDPRDPQAIDAPLEGPPRVKRVALVPEPEGGTTDPDVAESVRAAGRALEAEGYEVEEISPPDLAYTYVAWAELVVTMLEQMRPAIDLFMGADGRRFLDLAVAQMQLPTPTPEYLFSMHLTRQKMAQDFSKFYAVYPLVVGPVWTEKPFPLGFDILDEDSNRQVLDLFRFVLPANVLGLPAACVPTGLVAGLPTGVQVMGARMREDLCLDAAEAIERQLGVLTPIDPR
jgi:amidase